MTGLAALGIVFGDIGTSPLYTLKTAFDFLGGDATPDRILGMLSLVFWTLFIITTLKYVMVAMSIDNDGEGGILALMSLHRRQAAASARPSSAPALLGAALIYGDGAITPAISVLSALEGLDIAAPSFSHYVVPAAVAILALLFAVQPLGTARIGAAFGPVMALWFVIDRGARSVGHRAGSAGAARDQSALRLAPACRQWAARLFGAGRDFSLRHRRRGALCRYGTFRQGPDPPRLVVDRVSLPCPQLCRPVARSRLSGESIANNVFYRLCPQPLLMPLICLATLATIIASQSIITGAFSMTRQAIQLGWLPRLHIKQTSEQGYGQIYVGVVNWLLMTVTIALTVMFHRSDDLAAAYGIAVSLTMLMTSFLLFIAMREIWQWNLAASAVTAGLFVIVDAGFFAANSLKIADGGYVPLLLAAAVYGLMLIWHRGTVAVAHSLEQTPVAMPEFLADLKARGVPRVPGTAVFLTRTAGGVPPVHGLAFAAKPRAARARRGAAGFDRIAAAGALARSDDGGAGRRQLVARDRAFRFYAAPRYSAPAEGSPAARLRSLAR